MRSDSSSLWRHADFLKLWAGETISLLGSQVTLLAMPLVAALTLGAAPLQMGMLATLQYIPWLLVGLFAGAAVDRRRRRAIMVVADLGRMMLLALIPLAALRGVLRIEHLYVVGLLVGVLNVFFDIAYSAYLPTLVPRDRLVNGNSKLQVSASIAEIGGPGLAGSLVQAVSAPIAIAADAVSFLVSALSLTCIRAPEPWPASAAEAVSVTTEIREGLRLAFSNPILRAFALASVVTNFFLNAHVAVFVLYATRDLAMSPVTLGAAYAVASVGGLLGSLVAERLVRRLGLGRVILGAQVLVTVAVSAIPLAGRQFWIAVPIIVAAQALWGFGAVVYVVNAVSLRQVITPNRFQGRVTARLRFVTWGIAPLGFLLGGVLAELVGLRATMLVAVVGPLLSLACLLLSPVPQMRGMPGWCGPGEEAEVA